MSDFLSDVIKGAVGGSSLGPIGAAAGGALSAVSDIADSVGLTKWLFGAGAPAVQAQVNTVVAAVTGTSDPAAAGQVLARDHEAATELSVKLAEIAAKLQADEDAARLATLQAELADTSSARAQTIALATQRPWLAACPAAVTFAVLALWGADLLGWAPNVGEADHTLIQTVVVMAVGYWLGSSAGSVDKTAKLAAAHAITALAP